MDTKSLEKILYLTWNQAVQTCIDNFEKTNLMCDELNIKDKDKTTYLIKALKCCLQEEKHDA